MYQTEHYKNNELHYISGVWDFVEVLTDIQANHYVIYLN